MLEIAKIGKDATFISLFPRWNNYRNDSLLEINLFIEFIQSSLNIVALKYPKSNEFCKFLSQVYYFLLTTIYFYFYLTYFS